jgi:hypothetical protein
MQEFVQNLDHAPAQSFYRGELPDVHARKLLRQRRLVAGEQTPVREVIRKALSNEVMFLQRSEGVLKDRIIRTRLQRSQKLAQVIRLMPADAQKVLGCIEVERLLRLS